MFGIITQEVFVLILSHNPSILGFTDKVEHRPDQELVGVGIALQRAAVFGANMRPVELVVHLQLTMPFTSISF